MYFGGDYLTAVLNTNLHMYYDSIVDIHVVFTGQIQGDYIGVMDVFFYVDHLFVNGPFTCKWHLELCASLFSSFILHFPFEGVVLR
jgi:hypothetical protein